MSDAASTITQIITFFSFHISNTLVLPVAQPTERGKPSLQDGEQTPPVLIVGSNGEIIIPANGTIPLSDGLKGVEISQSIASVVIVALTYFALINHAG
jgi:hypothetical protein